jgi:hypothetical protein
VSALHIAQAGVPGQDGNYISLFHISQFLYFWRFEKAGVEAQKQALRKDRAHAQEGVIPIHGS